VLEKELICVPPDSTDLTHSLSTLRTLAATSSSPSNSAAGIELPPEILDYVDGGRNPDVYTREFVELVQRGNAVLNGKQDAFKNFSEIFAQELVSAMPETKGLVLRVMQNAGLQIREEEGEGEHPAVEADDDDDNKNNNGDETRSRPHGQSQGQGQHGREAGELGRQGIGEDG
jgi:hypothetical protein